MRDDRTVNQHAEDMRAVRLEREQRERIAAHMRIVYANCTRLGLWVR